MSQGLEFTGPGLLLFLFVQKALVSADDSPNTIAADPNIRQEIGATPILAGNAGTLLYEAAHNCCPPEDPHSRLVEFI